MAPYLQHLVIASQREQNSVTSHAQDSLTCVGYIIVLIMVIIK